MKNLANYYLNRAYAGALIVIAQTQGTGKSATYTALLYTKEQAAAMLERILRLEKTSPRYKVRTKKTGHFRLDQAAVRYDFTENPESAEVLTSWRRAEYDELRSEFFEEQRACKLGEMCQADNIGKKVLNEGHFGEWLICKYLGIPWQYNTENWKKGADVKCGEFTAEVKTVTNGAAQWQPSVNQYL